MKQTKTLVLLGVLLMFVIGMLGCGSSSSSGSSSTTTTTTTPSANPLVGTWNSPGQPSITFNANGTGSLSDGVHTISSWTLSSTNVLNMTLNGNAEVFQLIWTNAADTAMTLHNIGPNSSETTAYTKS